MAIIIAIIVVVPTLLYVPFIQDFAKQIALKEVKKSTGMDVNIGYLRLRFPLKVALENVSVTEQSGDTMVVAGDIAINVRMLPLLHGDISVSDATLNDIFYRFGTPDSAIYLTANVKHFNLEASSMNFTKGSIDIGDALLDGGTVMLAMKDTTTTEVPDTTASSPLNIVARRITLRNISYCMTMMPLIDSMQANVYEASLYHGLVDMANRRINASSLRIDSVNALYLTPSAQYIKEHPLAESSSAATDSTATGQLWTVTADSISLSKGSALYAMRDAVPMPGFDINYIQVDDIDVAIDSFVNKGQDIALNIKNISATERCGMHLRADGAFKMDSTTISAHAFNISTDLSAITFNADAGIMGTPTDTGTPLPLNLSAKANIALADIETFMPSLRPMLRNFPHNRDIMLDCDIEGTTESINIDRISMEIPRHLRITADGSVSNPMDFGKIGGAVSINGNLANVNFIKPTVLEAKMAKELNLPPTTISGSINYSPYRASGRIAVKTGGGRIAMDGKWIQRAQDYEASLAVDSFPVNEFMPSLGVGKITAKAAIKGNGYNINSPKTNIDANIDVLRVEYLNHTYSNMYLQASLHDGNAIGTLKSENKGTLSLLADFNAHITESRYTWTLNSNASFDLEAMDITQSPMSGSLGLSSTGTYAPDSQLVDASITINNLNMNLDGSRLATNRIDMNLSANDSIVHSSLSSGDLAANAETYCGFDSLITKLGGISAVIDTFIEQRNVNVRTLQSAIPPMDMLVTARQRNLISEYLRSSRIGFNSASLHFHNDTLLNLNANIKRLITGDTRFDTITFDANQHGKFLAYKATVNNRPGTLDNFAHVELNGFVADDRVSVFLRQKNINDKQGFFLGVNLIMSDSTATLKLVPYKPTIGYKQWTVNKDNSISFNFVTKHLDANLSLEHENSYLHLFTNHIETEDSADHAPHQEDVILQMSDIQIADWLSVSMFAPPVKGSLGADMKFHWDEKQLTGTGLLNLDNLYYGRDRVGSFDVALDITNARNGSLHADASLMVDSVKVITAIGSLNDTTAAEPFMLDFSMIHFPLRILNPFLPKDMAQLSGMLNGKMDITGDMVKPIFNGYLDFDSTAVKVGMLGSTFPVSDEVIPVDSNIVVFNDFFISGINDKNLYLNGTVDATNIANVAMDLTLQARNMQFVNSSRSRGADIYGKGFLDFDAKIKGNMSWLNVNASANLLPGSNITYVQTNAEAALTSQSTGDMVQFVEFNDSSLLTNMDTVSTSSMNLNLNANLTISNGTTINVDLSTDGKNKVAIKGDGTLDYSMSPMNPEGRLTGRFNINGGFVRYTPPFMSEKLFNFSDGSYVAFNGDILNPTLNVKAVDVIKANVTQEGQNSRLVNFDVELSVTNTLSNMNVAFNLSTDDDITVENELMSMSAEQRANQAMNLLLYNVYTGPGTRGNASLGGNPLYTFLESTLNSWAAKNVKGVDISFGIDQYDKTTDGSTASTTSYSYRVTKSLFNDRFKIIVGGNYSTDDNADENFSQNLVNDISFEYMINRRGTMYVRIFRHTGYESILEGEITQTGVGFVLKRKINSLRDLFRWAGRLRRRWFPDKPVEASPQIQQTPDSSTQK